MEALRLAVKRGSPFGSPAWQRQTASRLGLQSTLRPPAEEGARREEMIKTNCVHCVPFSSPYQWTKNAVTYAGGKAQNNSNPFATFSNHIFLKVGFATGKTIDYLYYDPSYGLIYKDAQAFQNALAGTYAVEKSGDSYLWTFRPFTARLNIGLAWNKTL